MDYGRAATVLTTEWGEEEFLEITASQEDGTLFLGISPISSAASIRTSTFMAWAAQEPADSENILTVYAYFVAAEEYPISKLLREVALSEDVEEVTFRV